MRIRIGEIQSSTDPNQWHWVEGKKNTADWTIRSKSPTDLKENNEWQKGPDFLKELVDMWQTKQEMYTKELLEHCIIGGEIAAKISLSSVIDITRYSSYDKLLRVTARVIAAFRGGQKPSLENIGKISDQISMKEAETKSILESHKKLKETPNLASIGKLAAKTLGNGVIVVGGRAKQWVEIRYDKEELPLSSGDHNLAALIARKVHKKNHNGVAVTIVRVRRFYWITKIRKIVSKIRKSCVTCKRIDKRPNNQIMGDLPKFRLNSAPAWCYTGLDFLVHFLLEKR